MLRRKISIIIIFLAVIFMGFTATSMNLLKHSEKTKTVQIDWNSIYPTKTEEENTKENTEKKHIDEFKQKIFDKEAGFEKYHTNMLPFYREISGIVKKIEYALSWTLVPYSEYNATTELGDGYFIGCIKKIETKPLADSLVNFVKECKIPVSYIQVPSKVDKYNDKTSDYSNENADNFINQIKEDVNVLDLREQIHNENLSHHSLFYRTDHHWTTKAGLWATREIASYLNKNYNADIDLSLLDYNQFTSKEYKEWFLGSQGKKMTLSLSKPDDFELLYPKYETSFHYTVPDHEIDTSGSYDVTIDMSQIEPKDYYGKDPYAALNYGTPAVIKIVNDKNPTGKKILLLRDSYASAVISNLALCTSELDCLDLRSFNGSVYQYIEEMKPDIILVMYGAASIDSDSENTIYNFRK